MQFTSQPPQSPLLEYPFLEFPAPGMVRRIAHGIFWVRMPLPFALDHINLWLLAHGEGWGIVDCGLATDTTRQLWERVIVHGLENRPVLQLVVTHCHPDHVGLASWLCEKFGVKPWMTNGEYLHAHAVYHRIAGTDHAALNAWYERHGLDGARLGALASREDHYRRGVPALPHEFRRIRHDEEMLIGDRVWRVIVGHGHSPEHAALYCEELRILIGGDMLLPRISTNVSVWPMQPEADPVREFLESLGRFEELPPDTLVLPSHGLPFRGLLARIAELRHHHRSRLDQLAAVCGTRRTAAELLPVLFDRKLDGYQLHFAMGEAVAHLNCLMHRGVLDRVNDTDDTFRFVRRTAP